jgi:hypothetical protein
MPKTRPLAFVVAAGALVVLTGCRSAPVALEDAGVGDAGPRPAPVLSQGSAWTWRNPLPVGDDLVVDAAYGNGVYVALGAAGTVVVSRDAVAWSVVRLEVDDAPMSFANVVYGGGLFVLAGAGPARDDTVLATSPDGVTWTPRGVVPRSCRLAYGSGRFACVRGDSPDLAFVATSPDGLTWTSQRAALDLAVLDVAYGSGTFVAVGRRGAPEWGGAIATSPDGLDWTIRRSAVNRSGLNAVVYAGGKFVATGADRALETSADGLTWTDGTIGPDYAVGIDLTHGSGTFVAVVENESAPGATIMTSPDGLTWTAGTGTYPDLRLVHGDAGFVATGTLGTILTSPDGVFWTQRSSGYTTPAVRGLEALAYDGKTFVAVGDGAMLISADGATWSPITPATENLYGITFAKGTFVAVGSRLDRTYMSGGNAVVKRSPDGVAWATTKLDDGLVLDGVAFGNGAFVAVGDRAGVGRVYTSSDGVAWSEAFAGNTTLAAVTFAKGLFVAVGYPDVLTSPDGIAWTPRKLPDAPALAGVAYGNGTFVAVAAPYFHTYPGGGVSEGQVLTSPDGIGWKKSSDSGASAIAFANGGFVAAGTDNQSYGFVTSSPDGATWTHRVELSQPGLNAVAYGHGRVVAVGYYGAILSRESP